ncbi:MAG: hypothetical protein AAGI48_11465 [Verrucomicrobiota bacterium]
MKFRNLLLLLIPILLAACGSPEALDVRPFHIREVKNKGGGEPLIDAEQKRRMYGAVGVREQEQRLGQYYTVNWHDEAVGQPVRVIFEYQQASSASKVLRQVQEFDGSSRKGSAEFRVIGEDYLEGGRVLSWRCTLERGGQEVASRHSYLWQ